MTEEQTHPDGAEYLFTDAERAVGIDSEEQVTASVQDLQVLYYDAFQSGIMSAMASFGGFPEALAAQAAQEITGAARNDENFVRNIRQSVTDRLTRTNLDKEYGAQVAIGGSDN